MDVGSCGTWVQDESYNDPEVAFLGFEATREKEVFHNGSCKEQAKKTITTYLDPKPLEYGTPEPSFHERPDETFDLRLELQPAYLPCDTLV